MKYVVVPIATMSEEILKSACHRHETARVSLDGTQILIKCEGDLPTGLQSYSLEEAQELMRSKKWSRDGKPPKGSWWRRLIIWKRRG